MTEVNTDKASEFLVDLTAALHVVSVPADITNQLAMRAANRFGVTLELASFQSYLAQTVSRGSARETRIEHIDSDSHWDLRRARSLLDLANAVGDGRMDLDTARVELARIKARPAAYTKPLVVLGYALYSGAVSARVGGSALDVAAGAAVGIVAGAIHYGAGRSRAIDLQQSFVAGLVGAVCALVLGMLLPLHFPAVLFGGVTLLVPAMLLTIATHELAQDALETGVVRFVYAMLRFLMLGFGIAVATRVWRLFLVMPADLPPDPLPVAAVMVVLVAGSFGLVFCLQTRMAQLGIIVFAVLLAYGTQELTKLVVGDPGSPFASAFVVGAAAHLLGRWAGHLPLVVIVPGLLQLAPGFLGTRALLQLLGHGSGHSANFFGVLMVALELVTGLLVATLLFRRRPGF